MSLAGLDSTRDAVVSRAAFQRGEAVTISWAQYGVVAIAVMIVLGFGMRVSGLGSVGFAEDEINKLDAVHAYDHGDFSANGEHPMLMKVAIDLSMRASRVINTLTGSNVSDEAALRFPNVLFGALTAIPLFLLTASLFDRRTALWAAAFWSFGVNAITYNRIGKEDTLMVFFMLFAFYFFIRAKQTDTRKAGQLGRFRNLSAVSFGLMLASKYFPHYFGLNMLFHHKMTLRKRAPEEPRFATPLSFFVLIGVAFLIANPGLLLPSVWQHLNAYSAEKLVQHTGYIMGETVYRNRMSSSPFWGLPLYFYLLFMAIKVPLAVLFTFAVGLVVAIKSRKQPGPRFILFMTFFWIVPYSLVGAKWLRYTLSLMPFIYMGAALGAVTLQTWTTSVLQKTSLSEKLKSKLATALLLVLFIAIPAWTTYASAPHYALYSNILSDRYTARFFSHDEFYDDGVNQAIQFVTDHAPRKASIVSEVPGLVGYYTEKFGRSDLQSHVLSDPSYTPTTDTPTYVILQRGRTYFENQQEMKQVKEHFTLVYAGCIKGHTAAEVYASPSSANVAVQPCGDARP